MNEVQTGADDFVHITKGDPPDIFARWLVYLQIIGVTFLQKISIGSAATQIFSGFLLMLAVTAIGLFGGRLEVRPMRFALYLLMMGGLVLTQLLGMHEISVTSLGLLLIIHVPYVFGLKKGVLRPGIELEFFQKVMIVVAALGIMEFVLQFPLGSKYAFLIDSQLPKRWIMAGYNNLNTVKMGTGIFKSNGFFMLEPAMFCQFLAISIIAEMVYFKRPKVILLFAAGILTTFSGTGLIILGLVVPVYLVRTGNILLIVLLLLVFLFIVAIAPFVGLDMYIGRINEFSDPHSSGFARFISIFPTIRDFILPQPGPLLIGLGAGSTNMLASKFAYEVHLPSWGKLWFDYGLIGLLCYMPLMINVLFAPRRSGYLKSALAIQFFFDGYLLIPTVHGLIIALLAWPEPREYSVDNNGRAATDTHPVTGDAYAG